MTNKTTRSGRAGKLLPSGLDIPDDLITFRVTVLSQLVSRVVNGHVGQTLGLSSRQWRLLITLNRLDRPSTSGEIAQFAHLDYSQVSRAGYELLQKGLVSYAADPNDRRKSYLEMTKKGKEVLAEGLAGTMRRQARLSSVMTGEEYETFIKIMRKLTDEARRMIDETRAGEDDDE
jgi:DNA-binding MarR family transcriptional regulator